MVKLNKYLKNLFDIILEIFFNSTSSVLSYNNFDFGKIFDNDKKKKKPSLTMKHPRTDVLNESVTDTLATQGLKEQQQHNRSVNIHESMELQHESTFFKQALYFLLFTILKLGY